jgi:type III pantothenate kinase
MLLTVDVGNTKTAIAAWSGSSPGVPRAAPTHEPRDWLAWAGEGGAPVDAIALATVVPAATAWWQEVAAALGVELFVLDGRNAPGLTVTLDHPEGVGPDRLANALGALDHAAADWVTIGFGTATILDVVTREGRFLGGAIAPGAVTALRALVATTARLPSVPVETPAHAIGRGTVEAMQAGAFLGHAAMVDGLVARMEAESGRRLRGLATGGLAAQLAPHCRRVDAIDPLLTLRGLRRAMELRT